MQAVLRNLHLDLKRSDVEKAAQKTPQGWGRKYAVIVRGKYFPLKDLMLSLINLKSGPTLLKMDFTTEDAARTFRRLGYSVVLRPLDAESSKLSSLIGLVSLGGNAVADTERYDE